MALIVASMTIIESTESTYNTDLDLLEGGEDVELSQTNIGKAVDGIAVTQLGDIEPTAATRTTSGSTVLVTSLNANWISRCTRTK